MRIAQVAPLYEEVPPRRYGGTERVVSNLTEELVALGHDVTLFAAGGSQTTAQLIPVVPRPLRLDGSCLDPFGPHVLLAEKVMQRSSEFDVIHFHMDYIHYPLLRRSRVPSISTLHGCLEVPELNYVYDEFREIPVVSISNSQRTPFPYVHWSGTVYHGIPSDSYIPSMSVGGYLALVGRISPEKGVHHAIEIAQRAGLPLKIAAKVDPKDQAYFNEKVKPRLDAPGIEFLGQLDEAGKQELLRGAAAMLFPIQWNEPFGLVMIEAMACGTPTIGFRRGSVPEVLTDGVTGFVVDTVEEAVAALRRVTDLSRRRIRAEFERRFTSRRMAEEYLSVYEKQIRLSSIVRNGAGERRRWRSPYRSALNVR